MRALFILLLLANIAFAGWLFYQQKQTAQSSIPSESASPVAGANRVVLLRELKSQAAADQAKQPAKGLAAEPEQTAAAQQSAPEAKQPEAKQAEPVAAEAEPAAVAQADAKPEPEPAPAPRVASQPAASCYTLGPFRELDKLREITRELKSDVLEASFRSSEERERSLFWVYLKPEADLKSAKNTTRMLRNKKIRDSYIIAEGKNRFGISLGHFRDKSRAYGLRDKVARLGFNPVVEPVFRSYTIYWLDYKTVAGSRLGALLKSGKLDKSISQFDRKCE